MLIIFTDFTIKWKRIKLKAVSVITVQFSFHSRTVPEKIIKVTCLKFRFELIHLLNYFVGVVEIRPKVEFFVH